MTQAIERRPIRRPILLGLFLLVVVGLALVALVSPSLARLLSPSPTIGDVAQSDILAHTAQTYNSEVLTEQKRLDAERSVPNLYTSPDTTIARQQLERLRNALSFITSVRADPHATPDQKLSDLAAMDSVRLEPSTAASLLALSDARWLVTQQEAFSVLEQVMRRSVRDDILEDVRGGAPALVSLSLSDEQTAIVASLVKPYIVPNSFFSETLTQAARTKAVEAVAPVQRSFAVGQTVVQRGQVLSAADLEALHELGLTQPQTPWQEPTAAAGLAMLLVTFTALYLYRQPSGTNNGRRLVLIATLFLVFLFGARLTIPDHTVIPYAFPVAAYSLLVAALFGAEMAMVTSLPLAILIAFGMPNALDLTLYFTLSSLFGVLALGNARRVISFLWAGLAVALSGSLVILIYRLPQPGTDIIGLATLCGTALFNGLASAGLTILLQFLLAQFMGMTTPMQLMELTRPDQPLLQIMLHNAPGTYQHSLQVANLAEQAAERIGADPLLTRVGALYHDCGKAINPLFFIENQVPGFINPHDDLDPVTSAATIIRHVTDGLDTARKYRLPRRVQDFISEHHGTMTTRYQYVKAVTAAGGNEAEVDLEAFRYPGPPPASRETAILMLADGCEARVRAERPKDEDELRQVIKGVIDNRIALGQLNDTSLTLNDLDMIASSFTTTLRGIYHPRILYPSLQSGSPAEITRPLPAPDLRPTPVDTSLNTPADVP